MTAFVLAGKEQLHLVERRYIGLDKSSSAVAVTVRIAKCARQYSEQRTGGKNQTVMLVALLREVTNSILLLSCIVRGFIFPLQANTGMLHYFRPLTLPPSPATARTKA